MAQGSFAGAVRLDAGRHIAMDISQHRLTNTLTGSFALLQRIWQKPETFWKETPHLMQAAP